MDSSRPQYDAIVVGAGPNGLAAAITLAERGLAVLVVEAMETVGGGARTAALTLPGFRHDVCSAIHPLALASPFFQWLPLQQLGVNIIQPDVPLAHPLDDGTAVMIERSVDVTADGLGVDAHAWSSLITPLVDDFDRLTSGALGPLRLPRHPVVLGRFGLSALRSAAGLADHLFDGERAKAVFAGMAAHSMLPLESPITASFGLVLGVAAHAVGWPIIRGGSQMLADGLATYLRALGGEIVTGQPVRRLSDLPPSRVVLLDLTPRQVLAICGDALPSGYRRQLGRFRYGMGAFKIDYALDGPVPWAASDCLRAGTVHLGGTIEEIAASERAIARGGHPDRPYVLIAQQSLFDDSRAPAGRHTLWAYCHVPNGSTVDMTTQIENQIARFAPGFRDRVLARHVTTARDLETYNPNYIGGDINGGRQDIRQLFTRPAPRFDPYATPNPRLFICSSSTPPGGGVHGLCGYFAASSVLRRWPASVSLAREPRLA